MKKREILIAGILSGMLLGMGIPTFAADAVKHVTASINETFKFVVNDQTVELPDEYEVLLYNNRTYLPVRAIGDMVGTKVDWDDQTKTITLTTASDSSGESGIREYKKLPVIWENSEFSLTVQTFTKDIQDHFKKIRLCLKNRQEDTTIRIDPSKTKYEIDGITYNYGQTETAYRDDTWYISVAEKDRDLEGYLLLPKDAQNAKKIHMEITVLKDTNIGQIPTVVKFDISV